jgi:hypothetical protein
MTGGWVQCSPLFLLEGLASGMGLPMYYYRYTYTLRWGVETPSVEGSRRTNFLLVGKGWPSHITPVEGDVLEVAHPSFCRWVCIYGEASKDLG